LTSASRLRLIQIVVATVAVALIGVGVAAAFGAFESLPTFTQRDHTIEARAGEELVVRLESNVTTGYTWKVAELPSQLRLLDDTYVGPEDGRIGEGGHQELRFRALHAGRGRLVLEYLRPFEDDAAPAQTHSFRVVVT
jgi:predicted secreted protein